jgi:hypothetical protein
MAIPRVYMDRVLTGAAGDTRELSKNRHGRRPRTPHSTFRGVVTDRHVAGALRTLRWASRCRLGRLAGQKPTSHGSIAVRYASTADRAADLRSACAVRQFTALDPGSALMWPASKPHTTSFSQERCDTPAVLKPVAYVPLICHCGWDTSSIKRVYSRVGSRRG